MKKLLFILLCFPMIGFGQVDLFIVEDYLNGKITSEEILKELKNKGYLYNDTVIFDNGDVAIDYVQKDGFDAVLFIINKGFLFTPKLLNEEGVDYFLSYINKKPLSFYFMNKDGDKATKFSKDKQGNTILNTYNGFTYTIAKNTSSLTVVKTDFYNKNHQY